MRGFSNLDAKSEALNPKCETNSKYEIIMTKTGSRRNNVDSSDDNSKHYLKLFDEHGAATPQIEALAKHGLVFEHAFSK